MRFKFPGRYTFLVYSTPLLILLAYFVAGSVNAPYSDFAAYYFGGRELIGGDHRLVYDTYPFNLLISAQGYKGMYVSYTPFTPFTSLVFFPLYGLNIDTARLVFNIIASLFFLWSFYRLLSFLKLPYYLPLLICFVFFIPLRNNIFFGQAYLLLFALLAEGFLAFRKKKAVLMAVCWGIAIVFKVFPAILLLYLLLRKEYRAAVYLILACIGLLLVSASVNGFDAWLFYTGLLPRLNHGELNDSFTWMFQSFYMLAKNLFVHDQLLNPGNPVSGNIFFVLSAGLFKAFLVTAAVCTTLKKNISEELKFGAWISVALLISPNGSTYSLLLLIIPFLALYASPISTGRKVIAAILFFIACNFPVDLLKEAPLLLKFPRLYLLVAVMILILTGLRTRIDYRIAVILWIAFSIPEGLRMTQKPDRSQYLLSKEEHLLITGIFVSGNKLAYRYWSEAGERSIVTGIPVTSFQPLNLADDQVSYNNVILTNTQDWKRSPVLIDGKYIVYLSDKHRGIGFYTLRKIEL